MSSAAAKNVAKDLLESVGKGKKVKLGEILLKNGYAQNTADSPKQVTNTKSFKEVVEPVVQRWEKIREKLTNALENRELSTESLRDITDAVDKLTKNIQLLSGKATEKIEGNEIIFKNYASGGE